MKHNHLFYIFIFIFILSISCASALWIDYRSDSSMNDTSIDKIQPDVNFGADIYLQYGNTGDPSQAYTFIDLNNLCGNLTGYVLNDILLQFFRQQGLIHPNWTSEITSSWIENTVTWNTRPTWGSTNLLRSVSGSLGNTGYINISISPSWFQGQCTAKTGYGFMLGLNDTSASSYNRLRSSDHLTAAERPRVWLNVTLAGSDNFPYYDTFIDNSTAIRPNATDTIGLSIHLLDDRDISYLFAMWNMTGTWANFTNSSIGLNNTNQTVSQAILYRNNQTIGYRFMFNDSANQWNFTGINTFIAKNISDHIPPDAFPKINLSLPLNYSAFMMGVDSFHAIINCSDDKDIIEANISITYGADTIFDYSTTANFIDQYHFIANNLTPDAYTLAASCMDNASQITYEYGIIYIYNYFNMSILSPSMNQHFFVPDLITSADINMTWIINQLGYCCDFINGIGIGCDYVPGDVEIYNQYLLAVGIYNITRACTIPDSTATIQDYRIVHVEIPIMPFCMGLNITIPYFNENATISANLTASQLSWIAFMWNGTEIYNITVIGDTIIRQDSIKNKVRINDSFEYGYNFSDSLDVVVSCYNIDDSIERPAASQPVYLIGGCPETLVSVLVIALCVLIALFFIGIGYIIQNLYLPIFGWILLIVSSWYLIGCIRLYAGIIIIISCLMILLTAIVIKHNDF